MIVVCVYRERNCAIDIVMLSTPFTFSGVSYNFLGKTDCS